MSLLHIFNAFSDMIFVDLTYNFRTINEQDFRYNSEYNNATRTTRFSPKSL